MLPHFAALDMARYPKFVKTLGLGGGMILDYSSDSRQPVLKPCDADYLHYATSRNMDITFLKVSAGAGAGARAQFAAWWGCAMWLGGGHRLWAVTAASSCTACAQGQEAYVQAVLVGCMMAIGCRLAQEHGMGVMSSQDEAGLLAYMQ